METKGDKTKQSIIKAAAALFSQKGYTAVTMKDLCEICELSRGGLYRHFGSTKEVFIEVLERDKNDAEESLNQAIASGLSAKKLISSFFYLLKNDIAHNRNRIEIAVYEFCVANPDQKEYLNERFRVAVQTFATLIDYGQRREEFNDGDSIALAKHIVFFLEGLKMSSTFITLSDDFLTEQFDILSKLVVK